MDANHCLQQQQQQQIIAQQSIQQQHPQNLAQVQHSIQQQILASIRQRKRQPQPQPQNLVQQSIQQRQPQNPVQQTIQQHQFLVAGSEPRKGRPQQQDFVENNSQILPIDFFPTQPVSTGLALSVDNGRLASSCDSSYLGLFVHEIESQFSQYKDDLGQLITVQADQLKREILENMDINKMRAISYVEQMIIEKFRAQEDEVEKITKRNKSLEQQIELLSMKSQIWQQKSNFYEKKRPDKNSSNNNVHVYTL